MNANRLLSPDIIDLIVLRLWLFFYVIGVENKNRTGKQKILIVQLFFWHPGDSCQESTA